MMAEELKSWGPAQRHSPGMEWMEFGDDWAAAWRVSGFSNDISSMSLNAQDLR
jgi:hypothetical protein